jgi:hypothetical protein
VSERDVERASAWNKANRRRRLEIARQSDWRRYGIPMPTRPEPQGCEVCGGTPTGRDTHLQNDHDHLTLTFRGWLCRRCNRVLGMVKDSSDLLVALARYLRKGEL